jgi:dCMP deaminase
MPLETRPSKDEFFVQVALVCASRSTCLRRRYGAVLVDQQGTIVATGYNGAPPKMAHCTDIGACPRDKVGAGIGERAELCKGVHAEQNALIQAGKTARGCTMYVAGEDVAHGKPAQPLPCFICTKMLMSAGVPWVVVRDIDGRIRSIGVVDLYQHYLALYRGAPVA